MQADVHKTCSTEHVTLKTDEDYGVNALMNNSSRTLYTDYEQTMVPDISEPGIDRAVPLSSHGYMLGVPSDEVGDWIGLQCDIEHEELGIDPHYAFFGCNTETQVVYILLSME